MLGQRISSKFFRTVMALLIITTTTNIPARSEESESSATELFNSSMHSRKHESPYPFIPVSRLETTSQQNETNNQNNQSICRDTDNNTAHCKSNQGDNTSSASDKLTTDEILLICGFVFTFIVGVFGNSFVCYVFGYQRRKHRSVTETLLLYLGIVDLLASLVNPLLFAYWTVTRYSRWDFGYVGCKILVPLAPITVTLSATIIIIICLDRYRAIVSPFKGRYSRNQINLFVAVAIGVSFLSYTGYFIHLEVIQGRTCLVRSTTALGYAVPYIVITITRDIGYTILFCFTSAVIFHNLKVNERIQVNTNYLQKRRKDSRRICRVLFCVGIVFALLVFPKDVLSLVSMISWMFPPGIGHTKTIINLNAWLKVLNISNSCVNVFIYSHMHARFKKELCKVFGVCFKTRSNLNGATTTMVTDDDDDDSSSRNNGEKAQTIHMQTIGEDDNKNKPASVRYERQKLNGNEETSIIKLGNLNGFSEAEALIDSEHM